MTTWVIDTSVGVKWFVEEKEKKRNEALKLWKLKAEGKVKLMVPDLFLVEIVNVLLMSKKWKSEDIKKSLIALRTLDLEVMKTGWEVMDVATELAEKYEISVYDALFAAVAKLKECKLVSDDARAHGKIKDGSVVMLSDLK